ncbi:MAG TPA: DUF721 domain-containing protein [Thermodesulfovibrionales bacterium]|nr:DUF721 domain-containing protein [Thermodesulfovibrionales bacterium]
MKKIGSLIAPLVRELGIEETVRFEKIKYEWGNIFSEPLSLHMYPVRLTEGELLINVDSPLWLQQLTFLKIQIIESLSSFEVRNVRFRIGKTVDAQKKAPRLSPRAGQPLSGTDVKQIEDTVADMDDAVIKESIKKAMEKSFAARNTKA